MSIDVNSSRIPRCTKHKGSGQAVVRLNGKDHYLGKYGSATAKAAYERLIAEWLAGGRRLPDSADCNGPTVNEVILAYVRRCKEHYRKADGTPTSELQLVRLACRPLKELYGRTLAREFGPLALKAVRERMIASGLSRNVINSHVGRIKRMFRWATENELVPASVCHALWSLTGLQRGRTEARETKPVKPVPEAFVNAILPKVRPQVKAMIELQTLTACRPGEVCIMRGCDLDMSGRVWIYRPESHKTEHHGHQREIYLGPKAQEIIRPWLKLETTAYLFSPAEAEKSRDAERRKGRITPMTPSQAKRRAKRNPKKAPGDRYTTTSFARAIRNACVDAGVPKWSPNRLRHNAATALRKEHGVEFARIILGHATAFTTEIYAEVDRQQALEVIAKIG